MALLATANLTGPERRALDRFVELLRSRLGDDLHAVWLYGSRARGDGSPDGSDVDVLVVTRGGRGDAELVIGLLWDAYAAAEEATMRLAPYVQSPNWVTGRREIESFFMQEVDRDKIVLHQRS
ncbi:MAG: nucleotidyltransferase domain-containing protein [Thermoleophilaceae bacterium]